MANEQIKKRNIEHVLRITTGLFLENGIEGTTKEMISRNSGLSRKSIDRYFYGKRACVIEAAEWLSRNVWHDINETYTEKLFKEAGHTGAEILKMYLDDLKKVFISNPRVFVFYSEFKLYFAKHDEANYQERYKRMLDTIGCRRIAEKIFASGLADGSLRNRMEPFQQSKYFCKSCFGFFSAMAIDFEYEPQETISQIDSFIQGMVDIYCTPDLTTE